MEGYGRPARLPPQADDRWHRQGRPWRGWVRCTALAKRRSVRCCDKTESIVGEDDGLSTGQALQPVPAKRWITHLEPSAEQRMAARLPELVELTCVAILSTRSGR